MKTLNILGIEGTYSNTIKTTYENPPLTSYSMVESFLSTKPQRCKDATLVNIFNTVAEDLARMKRNKKHPYLKGRIQLAAAGPQAFLELWGEWQCVCVHACMCIDMHACTVYWHM